MTQEVNKTYNRGRTAYVPDFWVLELRKHTRPITTRYFKSFEKAFDFAVAEYPEILRYEAVSHQDHIGRIRYSLTTDREGVTYTITGLYFNDAPRRRG